MAAAQRLDRLWAVVGAPSPGQRGDASIAARLARASTSVDHTLAAHTSLQRLVGDAQQLVPPAAGEDTASDAPALDPQTQLALALDGAPALYSFLADMEQCQDLDARHVANAGSLAACETRQVALMDDISALQRRVVSMLQRYDTYLSHIFIALDASLCKLEAVADFLEKKG
ncbi:hypothetical protein MSPP1_002092 [Malassezia sp. CBS 17886]|nr:hypothetical protein MSPP1_002092 [Malassezia sp. CBS 17886]